jgi:hypothetical protein
MESGFPFNLFDPAPFARQGPLGQLIARLAPLSMSPPLPWGQALYARLIQEHCSKIPGDLIECGVGLGGMSLFLGHLARDLGRKVYALDSFSGLPQPKPGTDNPYFKKADYAGADLLGRFKENIARENLADTVIPIRGYFRQSLKKLPRKAMFSFVHIDADLHSSVLECLKALYPRLNEGGVLVIDDFFHHAQGPARAAADYFGSIGLVPFFHVSFPYSVVMIKGQMAPAGLHRALDGNRYSLKFLKQDRLLLTAIENSAAKSPQAQELLQLLQKPNEAAADIYAYWHALAAYWDDMDAPEPKTRAAIRL